MARRLSRKLGKAFTISLALAGCVLWWAGHTLSAPLIHPVGSPPPQLAAQTIQFDGVHGWFTPAEKAQGCVLLLHGVHGDRRSMFARALFL